MLEEGAVVVEIVNHRVEVHFENGLVNLERETVGEFVEMELTSSLDEDKFVVKIGKSLTLNQFLGGAEEVAFHWEIVGAGTDFLAHTDDFLDASAACHEGDATVERTREFSALKDVADDEGASLLLRVGATLHEVECDVERMDVGVVAVVDERASVASILHFETHGNGFEVLHALADFLHIEMETHASGKTGDGILNGGIVDERNGELPENIVDGEFHRGVYIFLLDGADDDGGIARTCVLVGVPCDAFHTLGHHLRATRDAVVAHVDDTHAAVLEQLEFLRTLDVVGKEILFAGISDPVQSDVLE